MTVFFWCSGRRTAEEPDRLEEWRFQVIARDKLGHPHPFVPMIKRYLNDSHIFRVGN